MPAHLKDRNAQIKSRLVLPPGHVLEDLHVGRRQYTVLSTGPCGLRYASAARVAHTHEGVRFSPHPVRLSATDLRELLLVPPAFLKRLVLPGDADHPLAAHRDALTLVRREVLSPLLTRVGSRLNATPEEHARRLSRRVRVLQTARTQAQAPGSLWIYNSAACVLLPFAGRKTRELEDQAVHRSFRLKPDQLLLSARPLLPRGRA